MTSMVAKDRVSAKEHESTPRCLELVSDQKCDRLLPESEDIVSVLTTACTKTASRCCCTVKPLVVPTAATLLVPLAEAWTR